MRSDDETIDRIIEYVIIDALGDSTASGGEIRVAHAGTSYATTCKLWRWNQVQNQVRSV